MANLIYRQIEVSPRRWLTIPLEYANREFAGTAILALEAAERGWGTIFGSKIIRTRSNLPRGVIIERWITRGMLPKLAASYMRGRKLTAWCEEGLVYPDAAAYGRRKVDHKAYGLLDAFFAWGRNQADDLVQKLGCDGSKLTVTGNPRFDLYRTDLRGILSKKVTDVKAEHGNFILVNTSFPDFNGSFTPEFTFAKLHKLAVVPSAELESEVRGRALFQTELFGRFVELIELLCRHFPTYRIVVRPHPSEELGRWKQRTTAFPNVEVCRTGSVAEWILASSVCVHNNCTTGVEAYLLNKTSVAYSPITHPRFDLFLPNALSVQTFAPEETLSVIDRVLKGGRICSDAEAANKAEIARHFIANIDGPRASERILEVLDALPIKAEALSLLSGRLRDLRTAVGRRIALAKSTVKGGVGAIQKRSSKHNLDGLSKREMLQFLKEAKAASGKFNDVQVVELEKNVLCVYAESR